MNTLPYRGMVLHARPIGAVRLHPIIAMPPPIETDDDFFCGCFDLTFGELTADAGSPWSFLLDSFKRRGESPPRGLFRPSTFADLNAPAKDLLQWCLDFLLYRRDSNNEDFPMRGTTQTHKNKYVTVWTFLCDFLHVDKKFGYLVLSMLEHYKFINHGSGIRCPWIVGFDDRSCPADRVRQIRDWATNAPDDL